MSPSQESQYLKDLFTIFSANFPQDDDHMFIARSIYDQVHHAAKECPDVSYEDTQISPNGIACKVIRPTSASPKHAMLFMHGGGFSQGSPNGHRKMTAHLAKACGCVALSVDYRLTPEHPFPIPLEDCIDAYRFLLDQGFSPDKIVLAGDSCGGGLVTAVPLALAEKNLPRPAASVSLSPWYDMTTVEGGTMETNQAHDAINTKEFVKRLGDRYTGGDVSLKANPLVSPLHASDQQIANLPPHWISVGSFDMLRDHGERMHARLEKQGVESKLEVQEEQQHVSEFMAGRAPEADASIAHIGRWVREKLGT